LAEPVTAPSELRARAWAVVGCFAATLAFGLLLLIFFEPDVQEVDAAELADRAGEARAYLIADLFFPLFYGVLSPIAQLRFGAATRRAEGGDDRPAGFVIAAAVLLAGGGLFDWAENTLLLTAVDSESQSTVDVAHAVAIPKLVLSVAGALLALVVLWRAVAVLRGRR
jgi:hypothetical protein